MPRHILSTQKENNKVEGLRTLGELPALSVVEMVIARGVQYR